MKTAFEYHEQWMIEEGANLKYTQGHTVMHTLRVGGLRPARYTQGHTVMHTLRVGGLRPTRYK